MIRTGKYKPSSLETLKLILLFLFPLFGKLTRSKFLDKDAEQFMIQIIRSRLEENKKEKGQTNPSFLDVFVKALQDDSVSVEAQYKNKTDITLDQFENDAKMQDIKDKGNFYSNQEEFELALVSNLFLLFFAGFDTQSTALSSVLYYLATNQEGSTLKLFNT